MVMAKPATMRIRAPRCGGWLTSALSPLFTHHASPLAQNCDDAKVTDSASCCQRTVALDYKKTDLLICHWIRHAPSRQS